MTLKEKYIAARAHSRVIPYKGRTDGLRRCDDCARMNWNFRKLFTRDGREFLLCRDLSSVHNIDCQKNRKIIFKYTISNSLINIL